MSAPVQLERMALLADRPFTHPQHSWDDLALLQSLAEKLRQTLTHLPPHTDSSGPRLEWQGVNELERRIVIANAARLRTQADVSLVGFFGHKRPEADPAPLEAIDGVLIGEFAQHPGVLSYCSQQLTDGNWGNLVVLGFPEARDHWRTSDRHAYAARELAPGYYRTIRLHNAHWPGGLFSGHGIVLQRTKYYDFQDQPPWHAVREFESA